MILVCNLCQKKRGEKIPFNDKSETKSLCFDCLEQHLINFGRSQEEVNSIIIRCIAEEMVQIALGQFKQNI